MNYLKRKENNPKTIAKIKKRIKYLEINLTKKAKASYNKNNKILMKETKVGTSKWKDIQSWAGRIPIKNVHATESNQ